MKHSKKGQGTQDILLFSVFLVVLGIGLVTSHLMLNKVSEVMINSSTINATNASIATIQKGQIISDKMDYVFFVIIMSFMIALIVMGYFTDVHSAFMVVYIIIIVIGGLLAAIMSSVWDKFVAVDAFTNTITKFPISDWMIGNLVWIYAVAAVLAFVATFTKVGEG